MLAPIGQLVQLGEKHRVSEFCMLNVAPDIHIDRQVICSKTS